jgi:YaiO family outer membrane protein
MKLLGLVAAFLVAGVTGVSAATLTPAPDPTATPILQFDTGASSASLTNGFGEWHSAYATAEWKAAPRRDDYVTFTEATRNGVTDPIYLAGAVFPASSQTILSFEGSFSPTHTFSPESTLSASLDHRLTDGWGYQLGTRHVTYPALTADIESLGADRYFGHYHVAYTLSLVGLSNVTGPAVDHRLSFTRSYGREDESSTSFVVSSGRDVESVNSLVAVYPLFEVDLAGRQSLGHHISLGYDLFTLRQGSLYHQTGVQLDLRERN